MSAIAATASSSFASAHGVAVGSPDALDHGFQTAMLVLTGLLLTALVVTWAFVRPRPAAPAETVPTLDLTAREAA